MAENARTGFIWNTFMKNREAMQGMQRAGFKTYYQPPGQEQNGNRTAAVRQSGPTLRESSRATRTLRSFAPCSVFVEAAPDHACRRNRRLGFRNHSRLKFHGGQDFFQLAKHLLADLPA